MRTPELYLEFVSVWCGHRMSPSRNPQQLSPPLLPLERLWNLVAGNGRACASGLHSDSQVHVLQTRIVPSWIAPLGGELGVRQRVLNLRPLRDVVLAILGPCPFRVFLGIGLSVSTGRGKTLAWVCVWVGIDFNPKSQKLWM